MAQIGRPGMSALEKDELWRLFKAGESFTAIGRALGKQVGSVDAVVRADGGIAPSGRHRALGAVTLRERETISRGLAAGESVRAIAQTLARAPSTISREMTRNAGPDRSDVIRRQARHQSWRNPSGLRFDDRVVVGDLGL